MRNGCNKQNKHLSVDPGILSQEWTRILSCRNGYLSPLWELVYLLVFSLSLFFSFSLFFSLYSVALGSPRLLSYPPSPPSSALRPPLSFPLIRPYPWLWPPCRLLVPLARGHSLPPPAFLRLVLSLSIYPSLYRVPFVGHREVAPSSPSPSFPPPSIPPFVCVYTTHICTYIYILMFIFSAAASCCRDEISGIPFKHLKESLE